MSDKNSLTLKLLELMEKTGYPIVQNNGQRKFGPPLDWNGPPPPKGCEVFIGKLPREIFEDELVPIFSRVGTIYELRLMMDFSGSNRGYAFVTYTAPAEAYKAIAELNGYEIRSGRCIGVVKSVDNCRLYVGQIPKEKTKEEIMEELTNRVAGIVDVILYKNCFDRRFNRGFAFVEFISHRAAAMARRALVPGVIKLFGQDVTVDWAEPEPTVDDEQMKKVKVLYARNFQTKTSPEIIQTIFENAINSKVERVKKIYDYAFVHFFERSHAELAMSKLQSADVDGSSIEIRWAKPVDRELYRIQKENRGNAKFNNTFDLSQTLMLYKQHVAKREYARSPREDEGIGSACAGDSDRGGFPYGGDYGSWAPAKLDSMCKRYSWALPIYDYHTFAEPSGGAAWVAYVALPRVGAPLVSAARRVGPLASRACATPQQAQAQAAESALSCIKMMRTDQLQRSLPIYTPLLAPPVQTCVGMACDYSFPAVCTATASLPTPLWRTV